MGGLRMIEVKMKYWRRDRRRLLAVMAGAVLGGLTPFVTAHECLIESNRVVEIRSPVEGLIAKVTVERGDSIKAGQVLIELDSTVERAAVEVAQYRAKMMGPVTAARSRLEFARKKATRFSSLQGQSFVSAQQKDEAEAEARLAEAEVVNATEQRELARIEYTRALSLLEQRTLRSPFDGYVTDRNLNVGDLADPNAASLAILRVSELDPLKVVVTLPLALMGKVKTGVRAKVTTEDGLFTAQAEVSSVDAELDAKSGTFRAHLKLANPDNQIPAGIRCEAEFLNSSTAAQNSGASATSSMSRHAPLRKRQ